MENSNGTNDCTNDQKKGKIESEVKKCPFCNEPCPNPDCAWKEEDEQHKD